MTRTERQTREAASPRADTGGDPAGFDAMAERFDALEKTYLRRRHLLDGPKETGLAFVRDTAATLRREAPDAGEFVAEAVAQKGELARITLNAAALVALEDGLWAAARTLAAEVTARDHHDLTSQRIIDAAGERARDLVTETDRWLATRSCNAPFRQIETRANLSVHFCCSAWQPLPIGRIDDAASGFWRSDTAAEIRRSVTEGDFTHCSRWHCPAIADRRLPPKANAPETVPAAPKRVILSHDRSCNISCPSCRQKLILLDHKASARLDEMFATTLSPYLRDADDIKVTGSGDPFGSRHFRTVLKTLTAEPVPRRRIQIHTNGLLANERAWTDLNLWENVSSVWVSVDGATAESYAELRRGGDFAQLCENLRFLGTLNRAGAIDSLRLDFVVQARNFEEMGDFVDLARSVDASGVYFLRLRNWGHFSADAFREMDVCDPAHPRHDDLRRMLADDRLAGADVDLGTLAVLYRAAAGLPG